MIAGHDAPEDRMKLRAVEPPSLYTTPTRAVSPGDRCAYAKATRSGCSCWHGGHQLAKKLTTTHRPCNAVKSKEPPPRVVPAIAGARCPTRGVLPSVAVAGGRVASSATKAAPTTRTTPATQRAVCRVCEPARGVATSVAVIVTGR